MRIKFRYHISKKNKGKAPWNKGKKMSKEYCLKSSIAHKGIKLQQSSYDKMADSMSKLVWITNGIDSKRIPYNEDIPNGWKRGRGNKCKNAISKGCVGRIPSNKGKCMSEEQKIKISMQTKLAMQRTEVRKRFLDGIKKRKSSEN